MEILCVIILLFACEKLQFVVANPSVPRTLNESSNASDICATPVCVKSAQEILARMDQSIDPCDNFYKFACGNFISTAVIAKDREEVNEFTILNDKVDLQLKTLMEEPIRDDELEVFRKVKIFYKSCMNTEKIKETGMRTIKDMFEDFGGWPVLKGENWKSNFFDWKETMYKLNDYGFGADHFIQLLIYTDIRNNSKRIIYIGVPEFCLEDEFLKKGKDDEVVRAYYENMIELSVAFGAAKDKAKTEMSEVLDFEISLANHTLPSEQRRNKSVIYNNFTVADLQSKYSTIPWLEYINTILPEGVQVDEKEVIVLTEPKYFTNLESMLKTTSKRTLANYIMWKILSLATDYLTDEILNIQLKLKRIISGVKELPVRCKKCVSDTTLTMRNLVGASYIRRYFGEESKSEILNILRYLRTEFDQILKDNDWMDEKTKDMALNKSKAMTQHVAYPDELLNDDLLTKLYGEMNILPGDYLLSALNVNRLIIDFEYKRLRDPVNKTEWISHADTANVNAFFSQVENAILLPAGILQGHFFGLGRPRYLNFGSLGSLVGHEITHGFDDVGRQFDSEGNLKEWWQSDAKEAFLEKTRCIINQYGSYNVPEVNMTINGQRTQGENIADNGGIKVAYFAYQTWQEQNTRNEPQLPDLNYTGNQMFWISMAQSLCHKSTTESLRYRVEVDSHSPQEFRVNIPFGNVAEFSDDFKCPLGSTMNPINKCKVW